MPDKQKPNNEHKRSGGGVGEQYAKGTHSNENDTANNQGRREKNDEIERKRNDENSGQGNSTKQEDQRHSNP